MCVLCVKALRRTKPFCFRWELGHCSAVFGMEGGVGPFLVWRLTSGSCCMAGTLVWHHPAAATSSDRADPSDFNKTQL